MTFATLPNKLSEPTEEEVRAIRNEVFGEPVSNGEWASCGKNWMRADSVEWLREKLKRKIQI